MRFNVIVVFITSILSVLCINIVLNKEISLKKEIESKENNLKYEFDKYFKYASNFDYIPNGGKHFMDIMNGSYAQTHFPCKLWNAGEKGLTLSAFE